MASSTSSASLEQTSHIPIADLSPNLADPATRALKAIVTLTWPFSSATGSVAFLLSEPDFRLRRSRGQVRVQFAGSCAKRVARSQIASGDEVILCLDGAEWIQDSEKIPTPGTGVEFELRFTERVLLKFRQEDSQDSVLIDLDHPSPQSELPVASILPDAVLDRILLPTPTPTRNNTTAVTQVIESEDGVYSSPAFVKRSRTSYGSLFEGDPFAEEDGTIRGKRRKRTRMSSTWTYMSRTPTPERDISVDSEPVEVAAKPTMTDEGCQTMEMDFGETGGAAEAFAIFARQSTNIGSAPYETAISQPVLGRASDSSQFYSSTRSAIEELQSRSETTVIDDYLDGNAHEDLDSASSSREESFGNPITGFHVPSRPEPEAEAPLIDQELSDQLNQAVPTEKENVSTDDERLYVEQDHTEASFAQDDLSEAQSVHTQVQYPDLEEPSQNSPLDGLGVQPSGMDYLGLRQPSNIETDQSNSRPIPSAAMSRSPSARSQSHADVVDLTESSDDEVESDDHEGREDEEGSDRRESEEEEDFEYGRETLEITHNSRSSALRKPPARVVEDPTLIEDEDPEEENFSDGEDDEGNAYVIAPMQDDEEMDVEGSEGDRDEYEGLDVDEHGNYIDENGNLVYPEPRAGDYYDDEAEESEREGSYEDDDMEDDQAPQRPPQQSGPPIFIDLLSSDDEEEASGAEITDSEAQHPQVSQIPRHPLHQVSGSEQGSEDDEEFTELQHNPLSDEEESGTEDDVRRPAVIMEDDRQSDGEAHNSEDDGELAHITTPNYEYDDDEGSKEASPTAPELHIPRESSDNDSFPPHNEVEIPEPANATDTDLLPSEEPLESIAKEQSDEDSKTESEAVQVVEDSNSKPSEPEVELPTEEILENTDQTIDQAAENDDYPSAIEDTETDFVRDPWEANESADIMEIDQEVTVQDSSVQDASGESHDEETDNGEGIQHSIVGELNDKYAIAEAVSPGSMAEDVGQASSNAGAETAPASKDNNILNDVTQTPVGEQEDETMEEPIETADVQMTGEGSNASSPRSSQDQLAEKMDEDNVELEEPIAPTAEEPLEVTIGDSTVDSEDEMVAEAVADPGFAGEPGEILVRKPADETVEEEFQDIVTEAENVANVEDSVEEPVPETLEDEFKEIVAEAVEEAVEEVAVAHGTLPEPMELSDEHPHMKLRNAKHHSPANAIPHFTRSKGAANSPARVLGLDGSMDDDEPAAASPARSHRSSTRNKKRLTTLNDTPVSHKTTSRETSFASALDLQEPVNEKHSTSEQKTPQVIINQGTMDSSPLPMPGAAAEKSNIHDSLPRPKTRSRKADKESEPVQAVSATEKDHSAHELLPELKRRGRSALQENSTKTPSHSSRQSLSPIDPEISQKATDGIGTKRSHRRVKSATVATEIKESMQPKAPIINTKENVSPRTPVKRNRRTSIGSTKVQPSMPTVVLDVKPTPSGHDASVALALSTLESPSKPASLSSPPSNDAAAKIQIARHLRTQLKSYSALKVLKFNRGKKLDVLAIVTSTPPEPHRAKGGPRHYQITFTITDVSIAPNEVIQVQVSRPYSEALPIVKVGDGILLHGFLAHPASKGAFQLRSDQNESSSWSVFKDGDEVETRGPPTEYGQDEIDHVTLLKEWFSTLDETATVKLKRANEKWE